VTPNLDDLHLDVLPLSEHEGLLLMLHKNKMQVWFGKASESAKTEIDKWKVEWKQLKDEGFPCKLNEPFQIYGDRHTWYLLTTDGTLWLSTKAKKSERKLELFRQDKKAPLRALITNTANNRTFGFAGTELTGKTYKGVWFELVDDKAKERTFSVEQLPEEAKFSHPLSVMLSLSRVLVDAKVLDVK
jgi:hypothetical protein